MRSRIATTAALAIVLGGCPAFLSDDFRIVSDGGAGDVSTGHDGALSGDSTTQADDGPGDSATLGDGGPDAEASLGDSAVDAMTETGATGEAGADTAADAPTADSGPECVINGQVYTSGEANSSNACLICDPGTSTTQWSNVANGTSCAPGELCSAGSCAPPCCTLSGACEGGVLVCGSNDITCTASTCAFAPPPGTVLCTGDVAPCE
jgi:hypothetical protein